jgi:hypothetical protein
MESRALRFEFEAEGLFVLEIPHGEGPGKFPNIPSTAKTALPAYHLSAWLKPFPY